ncbi:MAG: hypothetical protein WA056_02240 [Gallionella sp.]
MFKPHNNNCTTLNFDNATFEQKMMLLPCITLSEIGMQDDYSIPEIENDSWQFDGVNAIPFSRTMQ